MEKAKAAEIVKKPSVPLGEIVKEKYVLCLECGKKMRTLKAHLRKAHHLAPAEYYKRYGLEPKKFPRSSPWFARSTPNSAVSWPKKRVWENGVLGARPKKRPRPGRPGRL